MLLKFHSGQFAGGNTSRMVKCQHSCWCIVNSMSYRLMFYFYFIKSLTIWKCATFCFLFKYQAFAVFLFSTFNRPPQTLAHENLSDCELVLHHVRPLHLLPHQSPTGIESVSTPQRITPARPWSPASHQVFSANCHTPPHLRPGVSRAPTPQEITCCTWIVFYNTIQNAFIVDPLGLSLGHGTSCIIRHAQRHPSLNFRERVHVRKFQCTFSPPGQCLVGCRAGTILILYDGEN
jgi:hypothetical protein